MCRFLRNDHLYNDFFLLFLQGWQVVDEEGDGHY